MRRAWWALGATTAVLLGTLLWRTGGTFVYVLDDPAIHLTVARRLALDGTWGVVPGQFQAASSSPLWTILLAPTQLVVRGRPGEWVPLVLNLLAAWWVIRLLAPDLHRALHPGAAAEPTHRSGSDAVSSARARWPVPLELARGLEVVAVAGVVIGLLFLPGLAFFGMEHTLHGALVLATVLAVERRWAPSHHGGDPPDGTARGAAHRDADGSAEALRASREPPADPGAWPRSGAWPRLGEAAGTGPPAVASPARDMGRGSRWSALAGRSPVWGPLVLMALATWARGESAFVAAGLAGALVVVRHVGVPARQGGRSPHRDSWWTPMPVVAGLGSAVVVALGSMAVVNLAFGQGLLPNSVAAKTFGDRGDSRRSLAAAFDRLTTDPLLLTLFVVAMAVVVASVARRHRSAALFPAVVMVVATVLHVELGAVERSLRYEGYLVALGVLVVLRVLPDVQAWVGRRAPRLDARLGTAGLVVLLLPAAALQIHDTLTVPDQARVLGEQRYQVARFLDGAYDTEPIAIGELGYVALYHDGPLTDVYGLGDHEVLDATLDDRKDAAFWRRLHAQRGFRVVVAYDFSLGGEEPREWFPVASWRSPDAFYPVTTFWATTPAEVAPLRRHLEAFEPQLPDDVEVTYNPLATTAAQAQLQTDPA